MTKVKMCGLTRPQDIETVNNLHPDYIGFVFWPRSKRNISPESAKELKDTLDPSIKTVGVFVDEDVNKVAALLNDGIIDIAQIHGNEDEAYIAKLRSLSNKPIIKAFKIKSSADIADANASSADYVLLDSGMGTGNAFDWSFVGGIHRPYFLAGGLNPETVSTAVDTLHPFAVDVSSGIESDGVKDSKKMAAFMAAIPT